MTKEIRNCTLCKSENFTKIKDIADYRTARKGLFNIARCKDCGNVFLLNKEKNLYEGYIGAYNKKATIHKNSILYYIWCKLTGNYVINLWKKKGKILDVGCGGGQYIETFKQLGLDAYGTEVDRNSFEICKKMGLKVFYGEIKDIKSKLKKMSFDHIFVSQVLEHIENPKDFIKNLKHISKEGTSIYISVPNYNSIWRKMFGDYWSGWHFPYHLTFFNIKRLKNILQNEGLKIKKIKKITPDHWIWVSINSRLFKGKKSVPFHFLYRILLLPIIKIVDFIFSSGDCILIEAKK